MLLIIDRFEGDFAICEDETLQTVHIRKSELPSEATEGDCLRTGSQKGYILDTDETARRKARILRKPDHLFDE